MQRVLVPPFPGLTSAYGLLVADLIVDIAQTDILSDPDGHQLESRFAALDDRLHSAIREQSLPNDGWSIEASIDMRYTGQAYEIVVPVERPIVSIDGITAQFHALHGLRYGVVRPNDPVQAVTLRLRASHPVPGLPIPAPAVEGTPESEFADVMLIDGPTRIPFFRRDSLPRSFSAPGPCVIEEPTATTFIPLDGRLRSIARGA